MKRIGFLLLIPLLAIVLLSIIRYWSRLNIQIDTTGMFGKKQIIAPLAKTDPTADLASYLKEKKIDIQDAVSATESGLLVVLLDGTKVLFNPYKDLKLQVDSLQIIRDRLTIEGRSAQKVDLRFSDPLVVY